MNNKFYSFLLLLIYTICVEAQEVSVSGFLFDSFTHEQLDSVSIRLLTPDSTEIKRYTSSRSGKWDMLPERIKAGHYIMHFSKNGYHDVYKDVYFKYVKNRIKSGSFGEILMRKQQTYNNRVLDEVVVTATRIKMVVKGDTVIYNADAFQLREGSMLDRLISMLPGMEIKPGGEIFVNGKKVESLLVNGEDFFKGNPRVALENLPAYMVDKVKVYEKGPDRNRLMTMNPEDLRGVNFPLVVDVNLKKEYSIGWIANASIGGGSCKHYSGRGFALRFTPQSRIAFMGYSNDVYGNSYYDTNGNWQNPGGSADQTTHELSNDILITDKEKRYKINNTLTFKASNQKDQQIVSQINYLGEDNFYGQTRSDAKSRNWYLRNYTKMDFTPNEKTIITFQPDIYYNNYHNQSLTKSAEFNKQLTERYMGEVLDSLFFEGSSDLYRQNLLSSLQQQNQNKGHYAYAKGALVGSQKAWANDWFNYSLNASYDHANNLDMFEAQAYNHSNRQKRFTENPYWGYAFDANASYRYILLMKKANLSLIPSYGFAQSFRSSERPYFQLEGTDWQTADIERLSSVKNTISQYIDATNSIFSDTWRTTHRVAADLDILFKNKDYRKNHHLYVTLPLRIRANKLDYLRGDIDTLFHNTYQFFEPTIQYRYDYNNGKNREQHYNLRYNLSGTEPSSEYLTGYRDSSTPLVVRFGNKNLRNTYTHVAEANYSNNTYSGKTSYFSASAKYTLWQNLLCQAMTYDKAMGIRTYRPDNINGNWEIGSDITWRSTLDKKKRINYTTETHFDYRHSEDYAWLEGSMTSARSSVKRFLTRGRFEVSYYSNYYSLVGAVNAEWNHSISDRFDNLDAFNISYRLSGGMPLPWKLQLSSNVTLYSRYGYSYNQFNSNQLIWSARLSRSFFNGLMNAEIEGFDLLNKMASYSYAINAQMQTETYRNVLRRYIMFNLTFRLNKEPKKRTI